MLYFVRSKLKNVLVFHCGLSVLSSASSFCNVLVEKKKGEYSKRLSSCGNFSSQKVILTFLFEEALSIFCFFKYTVNVDVLLGRETA